MKPVEIEFLFKEDGRGLDNISSDLSGVQAKINATKSVIADLHKQMTSLLNQKVSPDMDQSANVKKVEALRHKISELRKEVAFLEKEYPDLNKKIAATQLLPPNAGKVSATYANLHTSIQQIAREMPSLAMGPQMFFLAISNNLPMFTDALARARQEYESLVQSGQKGVPVWKQVVKSLFSWQTALSTGIMLLVMYGKEITQWAKDVFVGKTALDKLNESIQQTYEIEKAAQEVAIKTRVEMTQLMNRIKDFNGTRDEERRLVDELNDKYGDSFGYYQSLSEWYDTLIEKSEAYINILLEQAKQQTILSKIVEAEDKINKLKATPEDDYQTWRGKGGKVDQWWSSVWGVQADSNGKANRDKAIREAKAERDKWIQELDNSVYRENYYKKGNDINRIIDGSIGDIEKTIAAKRKALKDITNKEDYDAAIREIEKYEKMLETIKGKSTAGNEVSSNVKRLGELELAAIRSVEDNKIALQKDGYERERSEALLAFNREKERILAEKDEFLRLYSSLETAGYAVDPIMKQKVITDYDTQIIQAGLLYEKTKSDINEREKKQTDEQIAELLGKYQDYATRREEIEKRFQADIDEIRGHQASGAIKGSDADAAIAQAEKMKNAELDNLDKEILNSAKDSSRMLQSIFTNATSQSKREIENIIEYANKLIQLLNGSDTTDKLGFTDEQIAAMSKDSKFIEQIFQNLIDKKEELYSRGGYASQFIGGIRQIKNALDMTDQSQKTESINGGLNQMLASSAAISSAFGQMADDLAEIASLSGDESLAELSDTMTKVSDTLSSTISGAATGFQIGGVYGAIAGAVLGLFSSIAKISVEAEAKHWAALKEVDKARLNFQRQYNLLLLEQKLLLEDASSIFGEKEIYKAANAMQVYKDALLEYKKELNNYTHSTPTREEAQGKLSKEVKENYEKGIAGLANASIVTGHEKTGLFGWGKGRDVYSSILEVYPELIDANGELDTAMLQTILDTEKMSDSTRAYLEHLLNLNDVLKESKEELENYLKNTFGDLGNDLMNSVVAGINGSKGALEEFSDSIGDTFEKLGKQLAYSLFFAEEFDKLQKELEEIYSTDNNEKDITEEAVNLLDKFYENIGKNADEALVFFEKWKEKAADKGYDIFDDSVSQSGKAGAFKTMTQEQGTKLEGLFTSGQIHWSNIDSTLDEMSDDIYNGLDYLKNIESNTADSLYELRIIRTNMSVMLRDGVKAR